MINDIFIISLLIISTIINIFFFTIIINMIKTLLIGQHIANKNEIKELLDMLCDYYDCKRD